MNYLELYIIIAVSWILTSTCAGIFNVKVQGEFPEYVKQMISHANSILFWGIGGIIGIVIGDKIGGIVKYIVIIIYAGTLLLELIPYLIALVVSLIILFVPSRKRNPSDLPETLTWLFILARTFADASMVWIAFRMFQFFFVKG